MEKETFYKLVQDMRIEQQINAYRKLTVSERLHQWQIEFLVDEELFRHSKQNSKNPKTPVTFSTFSNTYCAN